MKYLKIFRKEIFWIILLLSLGFILRIWKVDSPIADWHSWRQADTAAVTRNFIKDGFNPLRPQYDDMSANSEIPITNPLRFRFVEFPIYNIFVYPFYILFGINDSYHRLVSVLFSLGSIIFVYLITKKYIDKWTAFLSAFTFTILPFNVFFSRTTLPEPTFIFFSLGMIYFVNEWLEKQKTSNLILAFFFTATAFLIKPWAIFFYMPLLYIAFKNKRFKKFVLFSFFALTPFILWRLWILQQPQGIPASSWLANGDGIRFRPAFWWWIVSERIGGEILSATGIVLFLIGIIVKPKNNNYFFHLWLLSILSYFVIFATGNVRHNYYQLLFVPVASVFFSTGFTSLVRGGGIFIPRLFTIIIGLILFGSAVYFSYKQVIEFYKINNQPIIDAGRRLDKVAPKDAVVLAPYNGDTAFLYQTNRSGWSFVPTSVKDVIADYNVTFYVSTTKDERTAWILRHFSPVVEDKNFYIVDLSKLVKKFNTSDPEPR